jgi:hypothetical protein
VAGRLLVYSLPPLMIVAGWLRGCRPAERSIAVGVAVAAGAVLAGSLLILETSGSTLSAGAAYASLGIFAGTLAMLIRSRRTPGGGEGGSDGDHGPDQPPPFDWDDFERRFWDEVGRRGPSSGSGRPASGTQPSRSPSRR